MDIQAIISPSILTAIILIAIILISLTIHEFAHAFVANLFGDPTAKMDGRMSLNPIRHWDPVGTTLIVGLIIVGFIFLRAFGLPLPVFGWGKPVPVDERNFDNPKLYGIQTALAGPMSNLILAALLALAHNYIFSGGIIGGVLQLAIYINIFLMFFNLLPIPPLDGSRLLRLFLPEQTYFALASSPLLFFGIFFFVFFFLLEYLVIATQSLTSILLSL